MPNSSGTFKTGEVITKAGDYECLNCKQTGSRTVLTLEAGRLFPYCAVCNFKDNTYKLLSSKR